MGLFTILFTLLALPAVFIIWTARSLAQNRAKAEAIGLPYLVRWISPINPFWLLYGSSFVRLCQRWGLASENLSRIYSYGWEANERAKIHVDYGDAFIVAHPGGIQLSVSNADIIYEILQRRKDFQRNMEEFAVLNVYGKNLSTTDDEEWQRHRKMTAVTFTEKNNEIVWQQSLAQADGMLKYWTSSTKKLIRSTHKDTKTFTLNVLAAVLFNKVYSFEGQAEEKLDRHSDDTSLEYRESLSTILGSIIHIFIFGEQGLKAWWTPKSWKNAAEAMSRYRRYILGLMNEERALVADGGSPNNHLVARLVQACEEEIPVEKNRAADKNKQAKKMTLTEEEIVSNLFVYAFAGNDTTSIALTTLLVHLAANPATQDWISEELNYYLPGSGPMSWAYDVFPKLKRCQAVMMESLRICHPISQLVKTTGPTAQPLKVNGITYLLPPHTSVHCSLPALNTHPCYWGCNSMSWNPKQFISMSGSTSAPSTSPFESEILAPDTSEHFMPWAWGQRVCPGKRFSQAELVAVLAVLFRDWRVEVVPEEVETKDQANERAWNTSLIVDHEGHMLHEMVNPETVGLRWVKRS
ncbi:cytochrome P450 monooxygenase-like protein [Delitschia confertaspora ATCC 74209]|uniref:Cytochrome P450 monooxygenase-like protein n=1 Tax=Delitschia confertaspora ATCC 74209 TaxID=1513339 RepID=A0A9P4MP39_9PLEO|nr:cytochrome P450 monooxygenase-like protein [Delitschia confertaspora ATCC 74209]